MGLLNVIYAVLMLPSFILLLPAGILRLLQKWYEALRFNSKVNRRGDGRVAVITGGASGIGYATAILFVERGWTVYAADLNAEGLKKLEDEVKLMKAKKKGSVHVSKLDVTNLEQCQALRDQIVSVEEYGIDALVNCAGVTIGHPVLGATHEFIDLQFKVNLVAPVQLSKLFFDALVTPKPHAKKHCPIVVNVSSISGRSAWLHNGVYASTKYGLEGFSDTLRREKLLSGIDLNVVLVEPGPVDTPLVANIFDDMIKWADDNPGSPFSASTRNAGVSAKNALEGSDAAKKLMYLTPTQVGKYILLGCNQKNPKPRYLATTNAFGAFFHVITKAPFWAWGDSLMIKSS